MEDVVPVRMPEPRHRVTGETPPPRPVPAAAPAAKAAAQVASSLMTPAEAWAAAHREEHLQARATEQQQQTSAAAPLVIVRPPAGDGRTVQLHESSVK